MSSTSLAQEQTGQKILEMRRIDSPPTIDGMLDEEAWTRATVIDDLHQIEPREYAAPSQATQVLVYYDDDGLYVAARLEDTDSERITANVLRQGDGLADDDGFAVILDPYLDRRSGYRFRVNPNGVRWEGLYQGGSDIESNWDGIWQGAATRDGEGWTAEMAIPFKTISFDASSSQWGMNFERVIQRNGESIGWVSRNREVNPGAAGTANGMAGMQQGVGLDVVPSLSVSETRFYGGGPVRTETNPSLDVFYKITPSLNGSLTINTDFSATEVDDRQVNLTRFGLFFPEKRDFFLQDSDIFEFGNIGGGFDPGGGGGNSAIPDSAGQNARPFFSRRIGLSAAGEPVDIDYGGKLSGRVGRWNVGALAIKQAPFENVEETDILVGRVAANLLQESRVGIILTDGDARTNLDNSLIGTDFRYRNSRLPGGRVLEGQAWYQETDTEGLRGDDRAFGAGLHTPNTAGWSGGVSTRQVEQNFYPAVGFIDQTGIRDYAVDVGYRYWFDDSWLRNVEGAVDAYRRERLDAGGLLSEMAVVRFRMENNTQDGLFARFTRNREVLLDPFVIYDAPDGSETVVIPANDYTFNEFRLGFNSGNQRRISIGGNVGGGEFYDGHRRDYEAEVAWRPSEHFRLEASYEFSDIDLPHGDFIVRLASLRAQTVFSSTLSWVNLIQYDNLSENIGINSRLHWIPQAGREGFIVINHNLIDTDRNDSFHSTEADVSIKFSYTWRF